MYLCSGNYKAYHSCSSRNFIVVDRQDKMKSAAAGKNRLTTTDDDDDDDDDKDGFSFRGMTLGCASPPTSAWHVAPLHSFAVRAIASITDM